MHVMLKSYMAIATQWPLCLEWSKSATKRPKGHTDILISELGLFSFNMRTDMPKQQMTGVSSSN